MSLTRRAFLHGLNPLAQADTFVPPAANDPTLHLLNRLSWGPRPEEVAQARAMGVAAFLDEQLNPDALDDSSADAELRRLPILEMDRRTLYGLSNGEYRAMEALIQGLLLRAVHSRRQLLERMVEFWSDHFNIPVDDDLALDYVSFQRDVIRPHALGRFRDLLLGTARSPAMLRYLDNYVNVAEAPNENYARELLELHTLGVDGGYTEADVRAVARAFTGWTTHPRTRTGFFFDPATHDEAVKQLLSHRLPAGRGIEDGLHVLSLLAAHPATATFICRKLCVRFVSDNPSARLVDRLAAIWAETDGAIRPVLRALFLSPEFQAAAGQKLRRPLHFFIGALRATGTVIHNRWTLEEALYQLGQFPYGWHPPNGYPDVAAAWLSTNGLLARWNSAMWLSHGAYSDPDWGYDLTTDLRARVGAPATAAELVDAVAAQVFGVPLAGATRLPFIDYAADGGGPETAVDAYRMSRKLASLYGLMLASPLFQWV